MEAIIFGFFGVLLVIQPGTEGFSIFSIFAILGMIGFAGRDLATRMSPTNMSNFDWVVLVFDGFHEGY